MEKKKKLPLPLIVLIVGVVIGLLCAAFGYYKQLDAKKINEERASEALKKSEAAVAAAKERLAVISNEYSELEEQYNQKENECDSMVMTDPNWFTNHTKCKREASSIKSKMDELSTEKWKIENADYTAYYNLVEPMSYQIFYIIGGSIAGIAALGAFIIYLVKGNKSY